MQSRTLFSFCAMGSAVFLAACGTQLGRVESMQASSANPYDVALHDGYLGLSQAEYGEGDYWDSDFFAERAMLTGANQRVEPQTIGARELPADKVNELTEARRRLIAATSGGAIDMKPQAAAQAQLNFDCWMQEQEENFQPDDIAACRDGFETAMSEIETASAPATAPETVERQVFDIMFDFDSDELSPQAVDRLATVAETVRTYENPVVTVLGNADQVGTTDYNVALSERRANVVARELEAHGITPNAVIGRGDQAPAVDNPDREPEEMNRRALIVVREAGPS